MRITDILNDDARVIEAAFVRDNACVNRRLDHSLSFPIGEAVISEKLESTLCLIRLGANPLNDSRPDNHFLDVSFSPDRYPLLVAILFFSPYGHDVYQRFIGLESTSEQKSFFIRSNPARPIENSFTTLMRILPDYYHGTDIEKLRVITTTFMGLQDVRDALKLETGGSAETNFNRIIKLIDDLKKDYDRKLYSEFLRALTLRMGSFIPEDLNSNEGKLFRKLVRKLDYSITALNLAGETIKNKGGSIASYLDDYCAYQAEMAKQASTSQEVPRSNPVLLIASELLARSRAALPPEIVAPPQPLPYDPRMFAHSTSIIEESQVSLHMTLGKKDD